MSATPTGTASLVSFWDVWQSLWTTAYPTDEEGNEAVAACDMLARRIIQTRSASVADVLVKVKILREQERAGDWIHAQAMLDSIIADLERLAEGSNPRT